MLAGWLDFHRATLEMKCAGLTPAQLATRSVEPSTLSLLGLVRHMARGRTQLVPAPARRRGRASLDVMVTARAGRRLSARWVLVHMVEEYARHNGHADLLRERIDGVTGE
jgi:Protein of unknown function (DUF664)